MGEEERGRGREDRGREGKEREGRGEGREEREGGNDSSELRPRLNHAETWLFQANPPPLLS